MLSISTIFLLLALVSSAFSAPTATTVQHSNALAAQQLNAQFATLKISDACNDGDMACVQSAFAQCVGSKWEVTPCSNGTICVALPLVNKAGTSLTCDTEADAVQRMQDAGADASLTGNTTAPTSSDVPCPMMTTANASSSAAPSASATSAPPASVTVTATSSSVAASASATGDDDCEGDDYEALVAIAQVTSSAAPRPTVGYTRPNLHYFVESANQSASSVASSASGTSSASASVTYATSVSNSASVSATAAPSDDGDVPVTTVTQVTTLYVTVSAAPPTSSSPVNSQASTAQSTSASAPASVSDSASATAPETVTQTVTASATAVQSQATGGLPGIPFAPSSQSTIITFISPTPTSTPAGPAGPASFLLKRPGGASASSSHVSASSAAVADSAPAVDAAFFASSRASATITATPGAERTYNAADIAFMLTATIGQQQ